MKIAVAEARILFSPAAAFRELTENDSGGRWLAVRRPLLLAFTCGCAVSLLASGRLSARLIVDGAVSFGFLPVFEVAALAAVYQRSRGQVPFARAADLFFAGNAPWLLWIVVLATLGGALSPKWIVTLSIPPTAWISLGSLVPIIAWSAYIDFHFFREVLQRPAGGAVGHVALVRAVGWSGAIVYFLGYAIWPEIVGRIGA